MAVMGRKKQMVAHIINNRRARLSKMDKEMRDSDKEKEISEEEHKKRLRLLKEMGILKEEGVKRVSRDVNINSPSTKREVILKYLMHDYNLITSHNYYLNFK